MSRLGQVEHQIRAAHSPVDACVAKVAARQHGVVSRGQLLSLGLARGAIQRRLEAGRLHLVHPRVYAVGHTAVAGRGLWMAALLACGPGALLSHLSAAALWGLLQTTGQLIDVSVPDRRDRSLRGIRLHRPRSLPGSDATTHEGIPTTTVARTLLDLAGVVDERRLTRAWENAERLRLLDVKAVQRLLGEHPNRRGTKALRALVRAHHEPQHTRSELESLFLDLCRQHGLEPPAVNTLVEGFEVDTLWRAHKLIVELDGYDFHRTRQAFERDRQRDAALQLAGYRVVRFTHRRVMDHPGAVAQTIRHLLDPVASGAWPKR